MTLFDFTITNHAMIRAYDEDVAHFLNWHLQTIVNLTRLKSFVSKNVPNLAYAPVFLFEVLVPLCYLLGLCDSKLITV